MRAGRNDPCPCGSGKKYKKCCGQEAVAAAPGNSARKKILTPEDTNLLIALFNAGHYADLESNARALLEQLPNSGFVWKVLGLALKMRGKDALQALQKAAKLLPNDAEAHSNLGNALNELGQFEDAVASFRRALALKPDYAEAHSNLGNALKDLGQYEGAVASYGRALKLKPDLAEVHYNLGNALQALKKSEDAVASYRRALALRPDYADAYSNLGISLQELGQLEDAAASYRRALEFPTEFAEVQHSNLGNTLKDLGRIDEATASYRQALKINPDFAEAHWNLSNSLLAQGSYAEGWQEFEYRWEGGATPPRGLVQPLWLGNAELRGKAILLHAEQGLGDTLQFIRYATLVAARGATVYLEVPPPLKSLAASCAGVAAVFAQGEALPSFDYQCPLMSLPLACKTELATIPAAIPYLTSSQVKVGHWNEKLGKKTALRVGLVWAGDPRKHLAAGHAIRQVDSQRSIHFDRLLPLLEIPDIEFISLQVGADARRQAKGNPRLIDFTDELRDFEDTAALIANLDMAICVDTSVAHLVGAVGKLVWLLNRYNTCWRWLRERADSPWYPTMRIFRQPSLGDWDSVIADVKRALTQLASGVEQR